MSSKNRVGRNPFEKKAASAAKPTTVQKPSKKASAKQTKKVEKAVQQELPLASAVSAQTSPAPGQVMAEAIMAKPSHEEPIIGEMIDIPEDEATEAPKGLLTKLLIELPADAYVLSLKARLFARSILK
jgi:hypothetical protein